MTIARPTAAALGEMARLQPRRSQGLVSQAILAIGLIALIVPTLVRLAATSWSTQAGAHGPIVFATAAWLIWHDRVFLRDRQVRPLFPVAMLLLPLLSIYVVGRITSSLILECSALYLILLTIAYLWLGGVVLRRYWFVCVYLVFLIALPENWVFVATRPIKMLLPIAAVETLSMAGLAVGSTGTMIQVDGYQLLVAAACSGVNSLIGISAISLFYVHILHGSQPRYAFFLALLVLPLAIATNFLRILMLVLLTHWFGEGAAEGLSHDAAAFGTFALALVLLLTFDALCYPIFRRMGWAN